MSKATRTHPGRFLPQRRRFVRRKALLFCFALLVLLGAAGGTYAWLADSAAPKENHFQPAQVSCLVQEVFDGQKKSDVKIQNTSDIPAYLRVALVANWVDEAGHIYAVAPDLSRISTLNLKDWLQGADGYYYYPHSVDPGAVTAVLVEECADKEQAAPPGYRLRLQVLAEAIQADPSQAVAQAWSVTVQSDGTIVPKGAEP